MEHIRGVFKAKLAGLLLAVVLQLVGGTVAAPDDAAVGDNSCVVPVFAPDEDADGSPFSEFAWTFQQLFQDVPDTCGCQIELRDLREVQAARAGELRGSIVVQPASFHPQADEVSRRLRDLPLEIAQTVGLMQHGAISSSSSSGGGATPSSSSSSSVGHDRLGFVFRSQFTAGEERIDHLLAEEDHEREELYASHGGQKNVYWFPLGHARDFVPAPVLGQRPLSTRSLLWYWAGAAQGEHDATGSAGSAAAAAPAAAAPAAQPGSEDGPAHDAEASRMLRALRSHEDANSILALGEVHEAGTGAGPALQRRRRRLYDARFVPCPVGGGSEPHLLWEALEAGAIPIVSTQSWQQLSFLARRSKVEPGHGHSAAEYLDLLQLPVLKVDDWAELPGLLQDLAHRPGAALDAWQAELRERYAVVKRRVRSHLAGLTCALRGAPESTPGSSGSAANQQLKQQQQWDATAAADGGCINDTAGGAARATAR